MNTLVQLRKAKNITQKEMADFLLTLSMQLQVVLLHITPLLLSHSKGLNVNRAQP